MKHLLFLPLFLIQTLTFGQDLSQKISSEATLLITFNGGKIIESVSLEELENSLLFEEVIHNIIRGEIKDVKKFSDFGVDFSRHLYLVNEFQDDVKMHYFTYHIKDLQSFESLMKKESGLGEYEEKRNIKSISYSSYSKLYWNNDYAFFITGDYIGSEYSYPGYESNEESYYYEQKEETTISVEIVEDDYENKNTDEAERKRKEERRKREEEEYRKREEEKERKRREEQEKREAIVNEALWQRAQIFFSDELKESKRYFTSNFDANADISLWYENSPDHFGRQTYRRYNYPGFLFGYFFGFGQVFNGSISSHLYLEKERIRLESSIDYPTVLGEAYERIFSKKLDKQCSRLIRENDIGYISLSASTKDFLIEYPQIVQQVFSDYDSTYQEEYGWLADLFTLIIDEDRIAEVVTGDVVFVLNDLTEKEIEYYGYDYDENYNSERVLKTRTEVLPDFSVFVGCKDQDFVKRTFDLGVKKEWLQIVKNGYLLTDRRKEFPFKIYFTYSNNLLISTTSADRMEAYFSGKVQDAVSSDKKKLMRSNSGAMFLNFDRLVTALLKTDLRSRDQKLFTSIQNELTTVQAGMNYKNGKVLISAFTPVPSSTENGAKYILQIMDKVIGVDKKD
ncbi:MAG: hypothetical protein WDZ35_01380 [Crocinitomicaceae bacterium]